MSEFKHAVQATALLALLLCMGSGTASAMIAAPGPVAQPGGTAEEARDAADEARDASEAAEAAAEAAKAAQASSEAAEAARQASDAAGGAGPSQSVTLSEPGQGVTASQGQAPGEGVSGEDRAAMDDVDVNPDAWSPL